MERLPKLEYYKPNKENHGAAVQFDLAPDKGAVFLETANQTGEQAFDWGNKITVKLDVVDLGKLLTVLNNANRQTKLFHDPTKREGYNGATLNTTIELSKGTQYGYYLRTSQQTANQPLKVVQLPLSDDEGQVLRVLMEKAVERIYGW